MTSNHRTRGIIVHCQSPEAFLLKEIRGSTVTFFLEPGSVHVRRKYAEEAIASGFLVARDRDLLGEAMTWAYRAKPAAPKPPTQFPRQRSPGEEAAPAYQIRSHNIRSKSDD
jgi:hypothetical protein